MEAGIYTVSSIVVTEDTVNDLEDYVHFVNGLGVYGVRVIDVVPSGECIKKLPLSSEGREKLIKIHKKINSDPDLPQMTTFSHWESKKLFGCGAGGIHHMYVDGKGNLRPCDFIPITFGNLTEEPLSVVYDRMREIFKLPEGDCFMKQYYKEIDAVLEKNKVKIVSYKDIPGFVEKLRTGSLPRMYKWIFKKELVC